jgi:SAM-dependent methyltransferase
MKKLHLGCGQNYYKGWINLDRNPDNFSDLMHDLEVYPWPFEDNTFDEIWADQLLEHLSDVPKAVREVHRILKPGGVFSGQVPYCGSVWAFIDPTLPCSCYSGGVLDDALLDFDCPKITKPRLVANDECHILCS